MIISHEIVNNNLGNVYKNIINPLEMDNVHVDIATCTSGERNVISNDVKYNYKIDGFQLTKVCFVVENINDEYDYYIKTRPEIILETIIDKNFLIQLDKFKINSRCRAYSGPPIDLKYGMSCQKHLIRKGDIQHNNRVVINPDDQMYIFHKSIKRAFSPIRSDTYLRYCKQINNKREYWVDDWMMNDSYWKTNICEREGHHKFIWYSRGFDIHPIGLNIKMNTLTSSQLVTSELSRA